MFCIGRSSELIYADHHKSSDQMLERFSITNEKAHDSTEFNTGP
jgi:hypothetical protein